MRILVVEDEEVLAQALVELFEDECYAVDLARDGATAGELAEVNAYDLVVLDWTIPPPSGIELLRRWRRQGRDVPVLMLTGRSAVDDRVGGLDTGADDFLTKPFALPELLARVRSLLRRRARPLQPPLVASDLEMDRAARRVTVAGAAIELSPPPGVCRAASATAAGPRRRCCAARRSSSRRRRWRRSAAWPVAWRTTSTTTSPPSPASASWCA